MSLAATLVLLGASIRAHRGRLVPASFAIALAASVLLAALVGQRALRDQAPRVAQFALSDRELHLAATDTVHPFLDDSLLEAMRADPRVARLSVALTVRAVDMPGTKSGALDEKAFYSRSAMGGWIPGRRDAFWAWDDDGPRGTLIAGRWPSSDATDPIEIVVRQRYSMGQKVDSWRRLESDTGVHRARVVGIIDSGEASTFSPQEIRLMTRVISRAAAERLAGGKRRASDARLVLHRAEDRVAFLADWRGRIASRPGRLEMWDNAALYQAGIETPAAESARTAVLSAILLTAACVVCIALGVQGSAVRERAAQLSLLRSLGASRGTLAAVTLTEALVLAIISLLGAVALAWGALAGLGAMVPFLKMRVAPDPLSMAVTGGVILAGVLVGSAWPAFLATRARPGEIAAYNTDPVRAARLARWSALAAGVVATLTAGIVLATPAGSLARAGAAAWVGIPGLALVAVLLAPLTIRIIDRLFVGPIAWLTRTDSLILADQVAGDGPRSTSSVVAVAVGLGSFLGILCWGASMLDSFVIDPGVPRWLVSIHPYGLDRAETERVLATPAFWGFQPLVLVDTRLGDGQGTNDAVPALVMGVDLRRALTSGPMELPFHFLAGDRSQAVTELANGNACLVSDWYAASNGVKVGDRIPVAVPGADGPGDRVYQVAGVVELRGWRMATKQNKVRLRGDKHRVLLVLDADRVRHDFPVAHANFLLGNPLPNADGRVSAFRNDLPLKEAHAASVAEREAVEAALGASVDLNRPVEYRPDGGPLTCTKSRVVQCDDLDRTRTSLLGEWGGASAQRMGWVPLVILALSLLSVSGALVASFRVRAREMGVLRSCGLSRAGLLRLTLAQSLLLGLAAVPVAAVFGGGGAWLMLEVTSVLGYRLDFAGIQPQFTIPWPWLWPGWGLTAAVCGLAALWAGWRVGRTPPASLMAGADKLP